jgi:acetyl-CoA acetyltransferase
MKLLGKSGWSLSDIELAELNEALLHNPISIQVWKLKSGKLNMDIVNVNGGQSLWGTQLGQRARIIVTLLHEMKRRPTKKGASLCIGANGNTSLWMK